MDTVEDLLLRAQGSLATGQFGDARAAADGAFAVAPADPRVREMYANVYLAHGIRLSALAREKRRQDIESRGRPGEAFEDTDEVRAAFKEVLGAFDRVLAANPDHVKALSLRAQALFRLDRSNRADAIAAYDRALSALDRAVPEGPTRETGRRNLMSARRRIERPCDWCDDTGFCTECHGAGVRTVLGFRRPCETCLGHGVCKRCGVL
ncbi:MAG TPA: hypothetical protein VGR51_02615 [Thermoplasmata archaeon]|jgi:tetratricopeptide (TPR) repeat protein|nr:hypothetical protein [Thermoplasmata archaeon]